MYVHVLVYVFAVVCAVGCARVMQRRACATTAQRQRRICDCSR